MSQEYLKQKGRGVSSLSAGDQAAVRRLFDLYAFFLALGDPNLTIQSGVCGAGGVPGFLSYTALGRVLDSGSTVIYRYYPNNVITELERLRGTRGAQPADLLTLYLLGTYTKAFDMDDPSIQQPLAACAASFCQPFDIFRQKATPSLDANNQAADTIGRPLTWNQLGMNSYWDDGDTPIYSWWGRRTAWAGKAIYENPVLTRLIPLIGPCIEAADAVHSLYEGRDKNGISQSRLLSGGILTVNVIFAVMDAPMFKAVAASSFNHLRQLKVSARGVTTAKDAVALSDAAEEIVRSVDGGLGAGAEAMREVVALGSPVDEVVNLGVPVLGSTLEQQTKYSALMHEGVMLAAGLARNRRPLGYLRDTLRASSRQVMRALGAKNSAEFGRSITIEKDTVNQYTAIGGKYDNPALYEESFAWAEKGGQRYTEGFGGSEGFERQITSKIDGEPIPLGVVVSFDRKITIRESGRARGVIMHWVPEFGSASKIIAKVDAHCQKLYLRALESRNRDEVIDLVAEIHYWEAALTRYDRGSNGIAGALAAAILKAKGIRRGKWKADVSPDFKAYPRTAEEYVRDYRTFFEREPAVPEPTLREVPATPTPPPVTKFPEPLAPVLPSHDIAGGVSVASAAIPRGLIGWAADPSALDPSPFSDPDIPITVALTQAALDVFHYQISVRQVNADCSEPEVARINAWGPSPSTMPSFYSNTLSKTTHGFTYNVPDSLANQLLRFYAIHPLLSDEVKYLGQWRGSGIPSSDAGLDADANDGEAGTRCFQSPTYPWIAFGYPQGLKPTTQAFEDQYCSSAQCPYPGAISNIAIQNIEIPAQVGYPAVCQQHLSYDLCVWDSCRGLVTVPQPAPGSDPILWTTSAYSFPTGCTNPYGCGTSCWDLTCGAATSCKYPVDGQRCAFDAPQIIPTGACPSSGAYVCAGAASSQKWSTDFYLTSSQHLHYLNAACTPYLWPSHAATPTSGPDPCPSVPDSNDMACNSWLNQTLGRSGGDCFGAGLDAGANADASHVVCGVNCCPPPQERP